MTTTDMSKELEVYKTQGANLLMPSTQIQGLSEFHAPVIETVTLSANTADGDVYPHNNVDEDEDQSKAKFRLTKQALMKLSVCAGIIWSTSETRRTDPGTDRNYVCYQAVGGLKKADGNPIFFKAQYDMDFEIIEEELRELYEKKTRSKWMKDKTAQQKAEYIDFCVKRDMLQKRKHRLKLAEAGAMNRVVREILGLKNAYTAAELSKPFVMCRVVFRPDYNDKDVKEKMLQAHIQAMTGIYGPAIANNVNKETAPIDITPVQDNDEDETKPPANETNPPKTETKDPEPQLSAEEKQVFDFENADTMNQCVTLKNLAAKVKYDLVDFQKRAGLDGLDKFSKEKRVGLFKHLLSMQKPNPDDVPY